MARSPGVMREIGKGASFTHQARYSARSQNRNGRAGSSPGGVSTIPVVGVPNSGSLNSGKLPTTGKAGGGGSCGEDGGACAKSAVAVISQIARTQGSPFRMGEAPWFDFFFCGCPPKFPENP